MPVIKYLDTHIQTRHQLLNASQVWNPLLNTNLTEIAHSIGRDRGFYDALYRDQMTPVAPLAFDRHIYQQLAHITGEIGEYMADETEDDVLELADVVILTCDLSALFGYEIWSSEIETRIGSAFMQDMYDIQAEICRTYRKTHDIPKALFVKLCCQATHSADLGEVPLLTAFYNKCRINLKRDYQYGLKQS